MPDAANHQSLRNALSVLEDEARSLRNRLQGHGTKQGQIDAQLASLIVRLTQIIRQEVVK